MSEPAAGSSRHAVTLGHSDWRDRLGRVVEGVPEPPGRGAPPFYRAIGDFQGPLYRRNAFALTTSREVDALVALLELRPGDRVLDVGCGDGRHLRGLDARGIRGVGIDVSEGLLDAAAAARASDRREPRFVRGDGRRLPVRPAAFDGAFSLHQGAFGTHPDTDVDVLRGLLGATRAGRRIVVTAYHDAFARRWLAPEDAYHEERGMHHQVSEVVGPDGARERFDLWTVCYSPQVLEGLVAACGGEVIAIHSGEPGAWSSLSVVDTDPELLLVARRG